jgi:uncharacterized protein (TIGR00255 family)
MIKSMTGFGKTDFTLNQKKIFIEIRTLNSKNLDLNLRISNPFKEKELEIRKMLSKALVRGKVSFVLNVENQGEHNLNIINTDVVRDYIKQIQKISKISNKKALELAMTLPNVLQSKEEDFDETEWKEVIKQIENTIKKIDIFRKDEGEILKNDFIERISTIQQLSIKNEELDKERIPAVKKRLEKAISDLKQEVDKNRFEQELIYYLEKLDITEEKIRLNNHLIYFLKALDLPESNGKKLGFITQEIGREINTTGSKANYAPMQQNVVLMKDELEKIKEQLLNVL